MLKDMDTPSWLEQTINKRNNFSREVFASIVDESFHNWVLLLEKNKLYFKICIL